MTSAVTKLHFEGADTLVAFLVEVGAERIPHSKRTFLEHLVGTAAILERWDCGERACKAGLFHSIYGTQVFKNALLPFDRRPGIRELLGEDAERLAYIFCAFERSSLWKAIDRGEPYAVKARDGGPIEVSHADVADLVRIAWANELEQAAHVALSDEARVRFRQNLARSVPFLSPRALAELEAMHGPARGPNGEAMPMPGLATLLNLESSKPFVSGYFPEKLYIANGPVERLAGLVDWEFDALVKMKKHHTKAFFRSIDGKAQSIFVQEGQERPLYEAGFTIYFHNLKSPAIAEWVDAIDEELGLLRGHTRVAGFASKRGQGLKAHYDQNDNFVCQAKGTKRWRLAPNTSVRHPTLGYSMGGKVLPAHEVEAPDGFPTELPADHQVIDTKPGTVMFMPRGMWHDTETVESESLHFNIQSGLPMWKDALEYVLTRTSALHTEALREPLVNMFSGNDTPHEGFEEELKKRLRQAMEDICESEIPIRRQSFHKFVAGRRPKSE
jgi:hypothetical protein